MTSNLEIEMDLEAIKIALAQASTEERFTLDILLENVNSFAKRILSKYQGIVSMKYLKMYKEPPKDTTNEIENDV